MSPIPTRGRRREREVLKYYQCWRSTFEYKSTLDQAYHTHVSRNDGSITRSSRDKSLVAFAQLTCLRLSVRRVLISLNTNTHEYVLAEAAQTTSLVSDHQHDADDDLWFGETTLPASDGLSRHALYPSVHTTRRNDGSQCSALALVVRDISLQPGLKGSAYATRTVRFFAGVPMVSRTGHHLGTLQVLDDEPRDGLSADQLQFLQDMTVTILDHLDQLRNTYVRYSGEKMLQGLSDFVQGHSSTEYSFDEEEAHSVTSIAGMPSEKKTSPTSSLSAKKPVPSAQVLQQSVMQDSPESPSKEVPRISLVHEKASTSSNRQARSPPQSTRPRGVPTQLSPGRVHSAVPSPEQGQGSVPSDIHMAFTRAADILRKAANVDGVIFYDATFSTSQNTIASHGRHPPSSTTRIEDSPDAGQSSSGSSYFSSRNSSSDSIRGIDHSMVPERTQANPCQVLGVSYKVKTLDGSDDMPNVPELSRRDLRRMIARYPRGKVFRYTEQDELSTGAEDTTDLDSKGAFSKRFVSQSTETNPRAKSIADALLRAVPGAKNALFFPLFDYREGKWSTGCFMWSRQPDSLLTAREVLSYIEAFGHSVMAERHRLSAIAAEEAKTTFIANISHELRSPLHGILGTTEFLQEAIKDPFHAGMLTTIETCGKTLLDTVDHVLDYAKINSLSGSSRGQKITSRNGKSIAAQETIMKDFDIAVLTEEVVEAIYAGQTFRSSGFPQTGREIVQDKSLQQSQDSASAGYHRTATKYSGDVRLSLDIGFRQNWVVRSQPGAISRIIMNLLGNAFKYTDKGSIVVALREEEDFSDPALLALTLSVKDTGRGMSASFLMSDAFTAFAQEDSFMPGTGLGLSIVQQLVRSLGGKIDLQSEKGVGTKAIVRLKLPLAETQPPAPHDLLNEIKLKSRGLTLCILDPDYGVQEPFILSEQSLRNPMEDSIRSMVQSWFDMTVVKTRIMGSVAADFFVYAEPPAIEYLKEHHGERAGRTEVPLILLTPNAYETALVKTKGIHKEIDIGNIVEVVSQPCGPQKLARSLYRCFEEVANSVDKDENIHQSIVDHPNDEPSTPPQMSQLITNTPSNLSAEERTLSETAFATEIPSSEAREQGSGSLKTDDEQNQKPSDFLPKEQNIAQRESFVGTLQSPGGTSPLGPTVTRQDDGRNALLVDDNDINLRLLVMCAKRAKIPFVSAMDGLEALQAYKAASSDPATRISYVCMDLSMPVMDGLTAVRHIRSFEKSEGLKPARIVALTGLASESVQREAEGIGFDAFLTKPVVLKTLIQHLQS